MTDLIDDKVAMADDKMARTFTSPVPLYGVNKEDVESASISEFQDGIELGMETTLAVARVTVVLKTLEAAERFKQAHLRK